MNPSPRLPFALPALVPATLLALTSLLLSSCAKPAESPAAAAPVAATATPERHPLKGVITDVVADQPALLVKHEAIPGYMGAMTMLFKVDAATLRAAAKGQAITATLVKRPDGFWLEDVQPVKN